MPNRKNEPERVGEVLDSAFLKVHGINQTALGEALGVHRNHVARVIKGTQRLSFEMAISLSKILNTEPDYWIRLQAEHDAWLAFDAVKNNQCKILITDNKKQS